MKYTYIMICCLKTHTCKCKNGSVGWGCRVSSHPPCPGYDTKQSDGEVSVMLELWGMWSTSSLPLLSGLL